MADDQGAKGREPIPQESPSPPPAAGQEPKTLVDAEVRKTTVDLSSAKPHRAKEEVILGPKGEAKQSRLSALQNAGFKLAVGVGIVIATVTGTLVFVALSGLPRVPDIPAAATAADITALTQAYEARAALTWGPAAIFDAVIVKALLPVFTLILGYIFGSSPSPGAPQAD